MKLEDLNTSENCQIVNTRTFNHPINKVYDAWTIPDHLKNWWGPEGFTNTFHQFDFEVGEKWVFTMHGPDKGNYENECQFILIEKPNYIAWQRISKPLFKVLAQFDALTPDETKVTFKMIFETEQECNKLKPYVVDKNEENFDRLAAELLKMQN